MREKKEASKILIASTPLSVESQPINEHEGEDGILPAVVPGRVHNTLDFNSCVL